MHAEPIGQSGRRLKSWKEIAAFFGCDERTVRRWEETRGLPVRRGPNSARSAVFAYESELRAWLNEDRLRDREGRANNEAAPTSTKDGLRQSRWIVTLAILVGVIAGLVLLREVWQPGSSGLRASADHLPNAEAQKFYRAGLYGWQSRTPEGLTRAVDDFTQAIVHDPQFAEAYAGLANCYNLLSEYTAVAPEYAFPRAKAAAERAIALDPTLADAHAALAFADFYWVHDAAAARREFKQALILAPSNATAHHWYATVLMNLRAFPEALTEIDKAQQLDSASTSVLSDRGMILFYAGKTDEAVATLRQLEQTEPQFASPHLYLAIIARAQGDDAGFVREMSISADRRQHAADAELFAAAARGLSQGGHRGMLLAMLQVQRARFTEGRDPAYVLAQTYAGLGDVPQALKYLKLSLQRHEPDVVSLNIEPDFERLRGLPAFRQLVRQADVQT